MYPMKKIIFLTCSLMLLLSSCWWKKEPPAGDLEPLRLGAMASMDYLPFVVAQKQGIYDSLGLEVEIVKFYSANDRDAAFQSGNLDGTVIDYTGAALQHANGIPLQIVMKNDGYFYLIASAESGVTDVSQLERRNVAVSRNTAIEFATDRILTQAGVSPLDVNKPEINKIPLRLEMLQNNQIDASVFPDPFASIALSKGNPSLGTTRDLGITVTGTIFSQKAIEEKPDEIRTLIKGYNLAVDYIRQTPRHYWKEILISDVGLPDSLVNAVVLPDFVYATRPAPKSIESTISWLKSKRLVPDTYVGTELVNMDFAAKK